MPGMRRREFINLLGSAAAAWPLTATAEQAGKVYIIGVLALAAPNPDRLLAALARGLREAGYTEGQNLRLELRTADAKPELLAEKAAELVRLRADVIVAFFTPPALAAKQETSDVPIVMAAGDPVATGIVPSLARPGGNITGLSGGGAEVAGKSVELIREFSPSARRIGVIVNELDPFAKPYLAQITRAGSEIELEVEPILTQPGQPMEPVFVALASKRVDALLIQAANTAKETLDLAIRHRLPSLTSNRIGPPLGALMSYGSDYFELARQCAGYVDRLLKGAKPADLPIAFPTKFELIINLKTAKALSLEIPPTLLARADEVIE
jgi:putative tryptophan/tyrosine transport system substrate-binding protein